MGTSTQGVVTYPVTVEVDDPDPALRPGMTAAVSIIVERHEGVLVVANRAIQVAAGQRTVAVLFEGQRISVPVTLGLVGDTTSDR
jgi:multidrug efflux pump subunit AcrA (membrane-fusion protein)